MSYFGIPIRNGLPIGLGSVAPLASGGGSPFSPLSLFSGGAPGAWYDPSDLTTLFQDSAGTVPVTAVEQPVGLMLDKSGYGNHAFQSTAASRPVLSARVNLLTKTEQFDDAVWTKAQGGTGSIGAVTANAGTDPLGGNTADRLQVTLNGGVATADISRIYQSNATAASLNFAIWARSFDGTSTYTMVMTDANGTRPITVTPTWQKFEFSATSAGSVFYGIGLRGGQTPTNTNSADILVWGASLVPANQSTLPYQRVNTATDYATTGFLPYLKFDGVDDSLSTNSISFTSTDKMSVFAGVRKLSDAAIGMIAELSVTSDTNNGAFYAVFPVSNVDTDLRFNVRGTANNQRDYGPYVAPTSRVLYAGLTTNAATSALAITARIDGTSQTGSNTTTAVSTGNFGNYPLFIGRRNNASLPFNGQLYSMIIVGKAVTAGELSSTETWVNGKTGAYA